MQEKLSPAGYYSFGGPKLFVVPGGECRHLDSLRTILNNKNAIMQGSRSRCHWGPTQRLYGVRRGVVDAENLRADALGLT